MTKKVQNIIRLEDSNVGRWVVYKPQMENERGKIKSFNNERKVAWVVYKCNNNWDADHWKDYTAQCTEYSDLVFERDL